MKKTVYFARKSKKRRFFRGFTLVELLTSIAVVGVLLALLLPAVQAARETARRLTCVSKMRQIGLGIHSYLDIFGQFPPTKTTYFANNGVRRDRHNILTCLLPYLERSNEFAAIDPTKVWSAAANRGGTRTKIELFLCPNAPNNRNFDDSESFPTDYSTCYLIRKGARDALDLRERSEWTSILLPDFSASNEFSRRAPVRPAAVFDGLSSSMMFFEDSGRPFKFMRGGKRGNPDEVPKEPLLNADWADPGSGFVVDRASVAVERRFFNNANNNEIFALHPGGANFLYGDGAARFHSDSIEPEAFAALFTCAAGDVVNAER